MDPAAEDLRIQLFRQYLIAEEDEGFEGSFADFAGEDFAAELKLHEEESEPEVEEVQPHIIVLSIWTTFLLPIAWGNVFAGTAAVGRGCMPPCNSGQCGGFPPPLHSISKRPNEVLRPPSTCQIAVSLAQWTSRLLTRIGN